MAYNSYFPQNYYPQYYGNQQMPQNSPQMPPNAQQSSGGGIIWVLGENAAKSFPVGAGQTVLLMDREEPDLVLPVKNNVHLRENYVGKNVIEIKTKLEMNMKSVDQSGMPLPLRIFDIKERSTHHSESAVAKSPTTDFVSRSEFEEFREDVKRSIKSMRKPKPEEEGEG